MSLTSNCCTRLWYKAWFQMLAIPIIFLQEFRNSVINTGFLISLLTGCVSSVLFFLWVFLLNLNKTLKRVLNDSPHGFGREKYTAQLRRKRDGGVKRYFCQLITVHRWLFPSHSSDYFWTLPLHIKPPNEGRKDNDERQRPGADKCDLNVLNVQQAWSVTLGIRNGRGEIARPL